jgi:2-dehydropantoate 2-reductase
MEEISALKGRAIDYLCIATKTSAFVEVLGPIEDAISDQTVVVAAQNGLDNEDYLAQVFGRHRVCRLVVNWAGGTAAPGRLHMVFFHPPNWVGAAGPGAVDAARRFAGRLTAAGLPSEYTDHIKRHEWEKTILNAAMSPAAALTGMTMKQVMENASSRQLVDHLLAEGIRVARASGIEFPDGFYDHCVDYLSRAGHHKPSLAVDLDQGRRTEIDFLNGRIVANARRLGIAAPYHEEMTLLIQAAQDRMTAAKG